MQLLERQTESVCLNNFWIFTVGVVVEVAVHVSSGFFENFEL